MNCMQPKERRMPHLVSLRADEWLSLEALAQLVAGGGRPSRSRVISFLLEYIQDSEGNLLGFLEYCRANQNVSVSE